MESSVSRFCISSLSCTSSSSESEESEPESEGGFSCCVGFEGSVTSMGSTEETGGPDESRVSASILTDGLGLEICLQLSHPLRSTTGNSRVEAELAFAS